MQRIAEQVQRQIDLLHEALLAIRYDMGATVRLESVELRSGPSVVPLSLTDLAVLHSSEISAGWGIHDNQITLVLGNASRGLLRVLWDRAVFVDPSNASHRLIHAGTRLVDREAPQPPSSIAPGSRIDETVYPSDYFSFDREWKRERLFDVFDISKSIAIVLPVEVNAEIHDYTFTFRVRAIDPPALVDREQRELLSKIETGVALDQIIKVFGRQPDSKQERATTFGTLLHVEYRPERLAFDLLDGKLESIIPLPR